MARLGAFCFPGTGHINPMTALARRLERRGHEVIIFGIADVEARVKAAGIKFHRIGEHDYPPGTIAELDSRLGELKGLSTFRFTVDRVKNTTRMILRDGPAAALAARVDALLVDEAEIAGSVADHFGLPYISIAFFPPVIQDDRIPPFCFGWGVGDDWFSLVRNRLGFKLLAKVASPIFKLVNKQREAWGLVPYRHTTDAHSTLAQITQLPAALEFDVPGLPANLHYAGPFVDAQQRSSVEFDWARLDHRPLIYASMGTLQNGSEAIFRTIAAACADIDAQLVISLGGGLDPDRLGPLPGEPIVVRYAPQLEILKRAALVITHAGLNTVLESLAEGVPMVAIPLGNDQPGVAARVAAKGAGIVVSRLRLNPDKLRFAVKTVLGSSVYRIAAQKLQREIAKVDGLEIAVDVIEDALHIRTLSAAAD